MNVFFILAVTQARLCVVLQRALFFGLHLCNTFHKVFVFDYAAFAPKGEHTWKAIGNNQARQWNEVPYLVSLPLFMSLCLCLCVCICFGVLPLPLSLPLSLSLYLCLCFCVCVYVCVWCLYLSRYVSLSLSFAFAFAFAFVALFFAFALFFVLFCFLLYLILPCLCLGLAYYQIQRKLLSFVHRWNPLYTGPTLRSWRRPDPPSFCGSGCA